MLRKEHQSFQELVRDRKIEMVEFYDEESCNDCKTVSKGLHSYERQKYEGKILTSIYFSFQEDKCQLNPSRKRGEYYFIEKKDVSFFLINIVTIFKFIIM